MIIIIIAFYCAEKEDNTRCIGEAGKRYKNNRELPQRHGTGTQKNCWPLYHLLRADLPAVGVRLLFLLFPGDLLRQALLHHPSNFRPSHVSRFF